MPSKLLNLIKVIVLSVFFNLAVGCVGAVEGMSQPTQTELPLSTTGDQQNIQPTSSDSNTTAQMVTPPLPGNKRDDGTPLVPLVESSFYYYADSNQVQLTPSVEWISVKFASTDPLDYSAVLQDSIVELDSQAREIPKAGFILLPLKERLTVEMLVQGINALRAKRSIFQQVNPVFRAESTEMVVTDEFIASFSAEKRKEEIEAINLSYGVEIVEPIPGQANTFILKVTENAELDTLAMANIYQENNIALYAAPNFIRIKTD